MKKSEAPCRMEYGTDEKGQEVLLKEGKFQVMMEWERPYMHACIDALRPFGDVLEIGFGLGYSAHHIQSYHPKSHTIIEYHPEVLKKAHAFAALHPHVNIVEGMWQEKLASLGVFDAIFFDDYPLESEQEMLQAEQQSASCQPLLQAGKELLQEVEKQLPFLNTITYSDADLEEGKASICDPQTALHWARFLVELSSRNQISKEQLKSQLHSLVRAGSLSSMELDALLKPRPCPPKEDRCLKFLHQALASHMRSGSRFSCFLSSAESKYADAAFVKEVIANPWLEFHEQEIVIDVPEHCRYFSGNKALVITVIKV